MNGILRDYSDYVIQQYNLDNSLQGLAEFIQDPNGQQQYPVNIVCIDVAQGQTHAPQPWRLDPGDGYHTCPARSYECMRKKKLSKITTIPDDIQGRIILVEDIDRHAVACLGTQYNLPLSFFATYLTTELSHAENEPKPPSVTLAPPK